jgi:multicomponent Na+:H+ antiporter subunit D
MSIAGLPPMGGFIAKLVLFDAAILGGYYIPVAIALLFAILTLFYMFRAWLLMFWGEERDQDEHRMHGTPIQMSLPIVLLTVIVVILGVYPEPLMALSTTIANQLLDPQPYISAVLERSVR